MLRTAAILLSPAWERSQFMMAEQRDREKLLLNAIVGWLIQLALDLPCPLEFLICEIINSLLFKPAWVRVLFLPPKASWLIRDSKQILFPLLLHPVAELNAAENYQQAILEAALKRRRDFVCVWRWGGGGWWNTRGSKDWGIVGNRDKEQSCKGEEPPVPPEGVDTQCVLCNLGLSLHIHGQVE